MAAPTLLIPLQGALDTHHLASVLLPLCSRAFPLKSPRRSPPLHWRPYRRASALVKVHAHLLHDLLVCQHPRPAYSLHDPLRQARRHMSVRSPNRRTARRTREASEGDYSKAPSRQKISSSIRLLSPQRHQLRRSAPAHQHTITPSPRLYLVQYLLVKIPREEPNPRITIPNLTAVIFQLTGVGAMQPPNQVPTSISGTPSGINTRSGDYGESLSTRDSILFCTVCDRTDDKHSVI